PSRGAPGAPPANPLRKRRDAWSCWPPHVGLELVERTGPALAMVLAARRIGERTVDQGELGLVAERAELEMHRRLVAARARQIGGLVMSPGEDQTLGPLDLDVLARRHEIARRVTAAQVPRTARPRVELHLVDMDVGWAHPLDEVVLHDPGVEHALPRRV